MSAIKPEPDWTDCPTGAIARLDRRLRSKRQRSLLRESAALIVVAAAIGITAGYLASPGAEAPSSPAYHFADISCDEVRGLLPELVAGRLADSRARQVQSHVRQCPHCGPLMDRMRKADVAHRVRHRSPHVARASQPDSLRAPGVEL